MTGIVEFLKSTCKEAHVTTEKKLVRYLKDIKDVNGYVNLLTMFYGYYAPLEAFIAKQITDDLLPDIHKRKRSDFILADLEQLHYTEPLAIADQLPSITNYQQAAGAMYVLEGSTLGGPFIAQMLRSKPVLHNAHNAMSFFLGYETENEEMWTNFTQHLSSNITSEEESIVVAQSGLQTFLLFDKWISTHLHVNS